MMTEEEIRADERERCANQLDCPRGVGNARPAGVTEEGEAAQRTVDEMMCDARAAARKTSLDSVFKSITGEDKTQADQFTSPACGHRLGAGAVWPNGMNEGKCAACYPWISEQNDEDAFLRAYNLGYADGVDHAIWHGDVRWAARRLQGVPTEDT